jgi:hypothetical protein
MLNYGIVTYKIFTQAALFEDCAKNLLLIIVSSVGSYKEKLNYNCNELTYIWYVHRLFVAFSFLS